MPDTHNGTLGTAEQTMSARDDFLATAECALLVNGQRVDIGLDLHGHYVPGSAETRDSPGSQSGFVIDRIYLGKRDISNDLPDEAMEALSTYINEVM